MDTPSQVAPGRGQLLGVGIAQLVVCELAALAILLHRSVLVLVLGPAVLVVVVLAFGRRHGRWLYEDWTVRRDFRRRVALRAQRPQEGSAAAGREDSRLAALHELHPLLRVTETTDRSGERIGIVGDGRCCSALLALEPFGLSPAEPGGAPGVPGLPLDVVADALRTRDVPLTGIQVITHTVPAPVAYLPESAPCARSYRSLSADLVPARRSTWIVPRFDPLAAPAAVRARGGGEAGAHRALLGTVSRLAASLRFAGVQVRPVGAHEALDVLSLTAGATGRAPTLGMPRTAELWETWAVDDTVQACFWVRSWPAAVGMAEQALLARLGDVRGRFNVVSLTMTGDSPRGVTLRAVVRVAGGSREELEYVAGHLNHLAAGARLVRLDGQHAPGVLESMPLGGSAS